jgi:hypothetical protein
VTEKGLQNAKNSDLNQFQAKSSNLEEECELQHVEKSLSINMQGWMGDEAMQQDKQKNPCHRTILRTS